MASLCEALNSPGGRAGRGGWTQHGSILPPESLFASPPSLKRVFFSVVGSEPCSYRLPYIFPLLTRYNKAKNDLAQAEKKIHQLETRNNELSASLHQLKSDLARAVEEKNVMPMPYIYFINETFWLYSICNCRKLSRRETNWRNKFLSSNNNSRRNCWPALI